MTEEEARGWVRERFGREAEERLDTFAKMVTAENERQNLIAPSTVELIWSRHVLDSAQLVRLAPANGLWLDVGTGGGFPGFVVALLRPEPTLLVEPRRRRAEFLQACATAFGMGDRVEIAMTKVERTRAAAQVISARAVAGIENLLRAAYDCSTSTTRWLLPRGRVDELELAQARQRWSGMFHMEQSISDPTSTILIIDRLARR